MLLLHLLLLHLLLLLLLIRLLLVLLQAHRMLVLHLLLQETFAMADTHRSAMGNR